MRGLYGAALGGSYLVQVAVQGATHHTPRPPHITTGAAPQLPPRHRYLTVYSTVKGTLRTQKALQLHEEMDLFFLGPTTGQRAVCEDATAPAHRGATRRGGSLGASLSLERMCAPWRSPGASPRDVSQAAAR